MRVKLNSYTTKLIILQLTKALRLSYPSNIPQSTIWGLVHWFKITIKIKMDEMSIKIIPFNGKIEWWNMWSGKFVERSGIKGYDIILIFRIETLPDKAHENKYKVSTDMLWYLVKWHITRSYFINNKRSIFVFTKNKKIQTTQQICKKRVEKSQENLSQP